MKNTSKFSRNALKLSENEKTKLLVLKSAIQEGLSSPRIECFDFDENLAKLTFEKK